MNDHQKLQAFQEAFISQSSIFGISKINAMRAADFLISTTSITKLENDNINKNEVVVLEESSNNIISAKQVNKRNIELSIKNLLTLSTLGAFTISSTLADIWLIPFAAVLFYQHATDQLERELNYLAGWIIYCVHNSESKLTNVEIQEKVQSLILEKSGKTIPFKEIQEQLNELLESSIITVRYGYIVLSEKVVMN